MSALPLCTWDADAGWLTPDQRPCPKTHCAMKGRCAHHVDVAAGIVTCPSCIGKVRSDLRAVLAMYAVDLPEEAIDGGTNSEAVNMLGPAVPGVGVDSRRGWCEWPKRNEHPMVVLGDWDMALRETYGPTTTLRITVPRAVEYLTTLLAGDFPHGDEFEDFARSISSLRARMEKVIHDERGPEKGAPCPSCALSLAQSDEQGANGHPDSGEAESGSDRPTAPRLIKRWAPGVSEKVVAGAYDTWHCPVEPEHWWTDEDYRLRVAAAYVDHADQLPLADIPRRTGVPLTTLRNWAAPTRHVSAKAGVYFTPPKLPHARIIDGRRVYSVEQVERLRSQQ